MFAVLKSLWRELKTSFGTRWSVLGLVLAGFVSRYDWFAHQLALRGITQLPGIPDWMIGLLILFGWAAAATTWHAVKLRREVTPRLTGRFDPKGAGVVEAIEVHTVTLPDGARRSAQFKATYVRIQLDAANEVEVHGVAAFVVRVAFQPQGAGAFEDIALPQPISLSETPIDVYPRIPRMIDFAKATEAEGRDRLVVTGNWPFALKDRLDAKGTYRFTVAVSAARGPLEFVVDVGWSGERSALAARLVRSG